MPVSIDLYRFDKLEFSRLEELKKDRYINDQVHLLFVFMNHAKDLIHNFTVIA